MSFMSGGGFMKCIPMTRSGRFTAPASFVSEIDEVLLARMASGFIASSHARKSLSLRSVFSLAASTTEIAVAEAGDAVHSLDAGHDGGEHVRAHLPFVNLLLEDGPHLPAPLLRLIARSVSQLHVVPRLRGYLGDSPPICPAPRMPMTRIPVLLSFRSSDMYSGSLGTNKKRSFITKGAASAWPMTGHERRATAA